MTPRTRAKNTDPSGQIYRSRNVPQQTRFPERKKTVRRSTGTVNDGQEKRQYKIMPAGMRRTDTVADSDGEEDLENVKDVEVQEVDVVIKDEQVETSSSKGEKSRRKKRISDMMEHPEEFYGDEIARVPKRRRKAAAHTSRSLSKQVKAEPQNDEISPAVARTVGQRKSNAKRRRQSTMTQMVDGRTPLSEADEPEFKPVKHRGRRSMGRDTKTSQEKKQQTLTQMVPGLTSFDMMSDEDMAEAESGTEALEPDVVHDVHSIPPLNAAESFDDPTSNAVRSVEDSDEEAETEYHPTQFIDAPITRTRRTRIRRSGRQLAVEGDAQVGKTGTTSLLSTPMKQRDRIIPSSQSPADSPLRTPISLRNQQRSPLSEVSGNVALSAETPSKRKKVTFGRPLNEPTAPPFLRKFESTIQDSEDEDSENLEWDEPVHISQEVTYHGQDVGADTQAILHQIDQACANTGLDVDLSEEESEELPSRSDEAGYRHTEASPELGETAGLIGHYIKAELTVDDEAAEGARPLSPEARHSPEQHYMPIKREPQDNEVLERLASTPPPLPTVTEPIPRSSPIVIKDEPSEDEHDPEPTPLRRDQKRSWQPQSIDIHHSEDLDGHPIQVPRSPSLDHETQHSHSSKAEQQLQNEWCSYSQYVDVCPLHTSSMNVAPDKFSYQATPLPPHQSHHAPQPFTHQYSQATTIDEVTPKKNRTYRLPSAHTTPRRIPSSQMFVSPIKPPPLFIPSSFPSPAKSRIEDWSSPVVESVQNTFENGYGGSIEEFSIPLPPPLVEDD